MKSQHVHPTSDGFRADLGATLDKQGLLQHAAQAMQLAYSPYSGFRIGVAILCESGKVYLGANIGNACSTMNCCAEQVALCAAVMAGERLLKAIALVQSSGTPCLPCGRCLQLLAEFAEEMLIITSDQGKILEYQLRLLLPMPYRRPLE